MGRRRPHTCDLHFQPRWQATAANDRNPQRAGRRCDAFQPADNHRVQIFDLNGKYLSEWKIGVSPSSLHFVQIGSDRNVVTFDRNTHKMLKYDLDGHLIYAWGTVADFPGTLWGVHGMSTDQEGNLYVAEVDAGRFQKFRPHAGANPATLIGKPIYAAWK